MLPESCAILGAVIGSLGGLYYLYETLTGKAQPNRITWLLWGIFPMVIFFAQRAQNVTSLSWTSFGAGMTPLLVFAASFFNRKAYWKSEPRDYALMAASILGIILWAVTDRPNLAILFSLLADLLAGLPTLIKCFRHPRSESWVAYAISALGFGIAFLSVQTYTFENALFVGYLFLLNGTFAVLASRTGMVKIPAWANPGGSMASFRHSREIQATPESVFAAIQDPARLARWWGPEGFTNTFLTFEFQAGGAWIFTMHGPDGTDYPNQAEFLEVVPGARVRIRHINLPFFELSISLERRGDGTLVSWVGDFENADFAENIRGFLEKANEQNLDRLAVEVAGRPEEA